ncbi:MAG: amino acid permease [Longimicrobiales bacterium]|nr:amino acid permease [Longimicrobiales bacterium]
MQSHPHEAPSESHPTSLPRVLGLWDIVSIVVGGVIGSGIFIVPAAIASQLSSPVLFLGVWVVGGILSFFGALAFAELAAAYPQAGGAYVYLREAYGPMVAFLFGWTLFLVVDSGAIATLAVAFSTTYLPYFVPLSPVAAKLVSAAMVAGLVAVNYVGVRQGANLQNVLTVIKFGALVGVCGAVVLFVDGETSHLVTPAIPSPSWSLAGGFGVALVAVLWAYKGWEGASYSTGETRDPARNLPWGLFIGTVAIIGIYLATNLAYLYVFPTADIAVSQRVASDAMSLAIGPLGASAVALVILFSIVGAANQVLLTSPRVYFAMSKDELFFRGMAHVHPRYQTPHVAIVAMGVWAIVLSLSGTFQQLFTYVIFGQWIFFGLTVGAVFILRRKRPDLPRPYRTTGYPLTPALFILGALGISLSTLVNELWNALAGVFIIALGLPAYFYWKRKAGGSAAPEAPRARPAP